MFYQTKEVTKSTLTLCKVQGDRRWEVDPTNHLFHAQWTTNTQSTPISTSQDPPTRPSLCLLAPCHIGEHHWVCNDIQVGIQSSEVWIWSRDSTIQQHHHLSMKFKRTTFDTEKDILAWLGFGLKLTGGLKNHNFNKIHVNKALPMFFVARGKSPKSLEIPANFQRKHIENTMKRNQQNSPK